MTHVLGLQAKNDSSSRNLLTPEGVELCVPLAPLGGRVAALMLDFGFMLLATILMVLVLLALASLAGMGFGTMIVGLLVSFVIWNGYFLYFELRWRGSTPGKRSMDLVVVSRDGGPLSTGAVMARNLMRELELYLPLRLLLAPSIVYGDAPGFVLLLASGWVFVFMFMPLLNKDRARVGDLVAGTIVVQRPKTLLLPDAAEKRLDRRADKYVFRDEQLDMYGIRELQVLEDLLRQGDSSEAAFVLLRTIADKICNKIAFDEKIADNEVLPFLRSFYRAQRRRLEGRLLLGERREKKKQGTLKKGK